MTKLACKGYTATVEADPDTGWLYGEVKDIPALLTISGCSMDDVKVAFALAVADYEDRHRRDKAPGVPRAQIGARTTRPRHLTPLRKL